MSTQEPWATELSHARETFWVNTRKNPPSAYYPSLDDIRTVKERFLRFAPFFKLAFPESQGHILSPLTSIEGFQKSIIPFVGGSIPGTWLVKQDNLLPIAGSIKARGGVHEVIELAEKLAVEGAHISTDSDYACFHSDAMRTFLSQYTLVVGSTGNLGLSIGTIGKALGFSVQVHMSSDAKDWKINRLKALGVEVILHDTSYTEAVSKGREYAYSKPKTFFVDDEHSYSLFIGYASAAFELEEQLIDLNIAVDDDHPLFVYLPCGVGGAPGGIAYALKQLYQKNVYLIFAEPVQAPCMLAAMASGKHEDISISDFGLNGITCADGLAVGRASGLVSRLVGHIIDGIYTVGDDKLLWMQYILSQSDCVRLEPSALAGFLGPVKLYYTSEGFSILENHQLLHKMKDATHISWATGGSLVPQDIMDEDIKKGQAINLSSL